MNLYTKKWFIAGAYLVTIGVVIFAAVLTAYRWNFSRLSTGSYETNTYEISEKFSSIEMNTETADVHFEASSGNKCKVVCYEQKNLKHTVAVKNGTLTVNSEDTRKWYDHIGINLSSPKVTVYLPESGYTALSITGSTGEIDIAEKLKFDSAAVFVSTGEMNISNISAGTINLSASTGDINVSDVSCEGDIKINVSTGEVKMMNVTCQNLISNGSTGNIDLKSVKAAEKLSVERSTGGVDFKDSDAAEIFVKTSTGNVTGSFPAEKVFVTETSTGSVNVPKTKTGGRCEIVTSTGDITIR